jgi:torulene dioxygenase
MSIYPDSSVINLMRLENLRDTNDVNKHMRLGRARRFRLKNVSNHDKPATAQKAIEEFTLPQKYSIELPTVNPTLYHKPYRFAYGLTKVDDGTYTSFSDALVKLDMASSCTEAAHKVWHVPDQMPSEPIFVPRPRATGEEGAEVEDDGVLLSVVLDLARGKSALVVLDAKEMKEVGRAEMETVFPAGFHGIWSQKDVHP